MSLLRREALTAARWGFATLAGLALTGLALGALADPPAAPKPKPAASGRDAASRPAAAPSASVEVGPPRGGYPPDPAGLASRKQWVFDVVVRNGKARLVRVDAVAADHAMTTARVLGRFAIELYIGKELLDRIRFNVPLTGDERDPAADPKHHRRRQPAFDDVTTRLRVQIADNARATYVQLVDRATGETQRFWWPPDAQGALTPYASVAAGTPRTPGATVSKAVPTGSARAGEPPHSGVPPP